MDYGPVAAVARPVLIVHSVVSQNREDPEYGGPSKDSLGFGNPLCITRMESVESFLSGAHRRSR